MSKVTVIINFDGQLYDYIADKPMVEPVIEIVNDQRKQTGEKFLTAKIFVQRVCMSLLKGEEEMPGNQKLDLYAIGVKLAKGGDVELTIEEAKKIQQRIRRACEPVVVGQIDEIIEKALA